LQLGLEESAPAPQTDALSTEELETGIRGVAGTAQASRRHQPQRPSRVRRGSATSRFSGQPGHRPAQRHSKSLRDVIAELDKIMQEQFATTFAAIAKEFRPDFCALFGGGLARLELTDPDDLTATGIDYLSPPAGQAACRTLSLLSGGRAGPDRHGAAVRRAQDQASALLRVGRG